MSIIQRGRHHKDSVTGMISEVTRSCSAWSIYRNLRLSPIPPLFSKEKKKHGVCSQLIGQPVGNGDIRLPYVPKSDGFSR